MATTINVIAEKNQRRTALRRGCLEVLWLLLLLSLCYYITTWTFAMTLGVEQRLSYACVAVIIVAAVVVITA